MLEISDGQGFCGAVPPWANPQWRGAASIRIWLTDNDAEWQGVARLAAWHCESSGSTIEKGLDASSNGDGDKDEKGEEEDRPL